MTASLGALDLLWNLSDETGRRLKAYRHRADAGLASTEEAWVRVLACLKGLVLGGEGISYDAEALESELADLPPGIVNLLRPPDASIRDAAMTTACSGVAAHGLVMRPRLLRASFRGRCGLLTTCVSVTASAIQAAESRETSAAVAAGKKRVVAAGGGDASQLARKGVDTITHHSLNSGSK